MAAMIEGDDGSHELSMTTNEHFSSYGVIYEKCAQTADNPSQFLWSSFYYFFAFFSDPLVCKRHDLQSMCHKYKDSVFCDEMEGRFHTCFWSCKLDHEFPGPDDFNPLDNRPYCSEATKPRSLLCLHPQDIDAETYLMGLPWRICRDSMSAQQLAELQLERVADIDDSTVDIRLRHPANPYSYPCHNEKLGMGFSSYFKKTPPCPSRCFSVLHVLLVFGLLVLIRVPINRMLYLVALTSDSWNVSYWAPRAMKCGGIMFLAAVISVMSYMAIAAAAVASSVAMLVVLSTTFGVVFWLDQLISVTLQPAVWWIVIRKFGTLNPGVQEYNEEYLSQWDRVGSTWMELRARSAQFLAMPVVEIGLLVIMFGYTILICSAYIFHALCHTASFASSDNKACTNILEQIDNICFNVELVFNLIFLLELILKLVAFSYVYLLDLFNLFDSLTVVISVALTWAHYNIQGIGLLRILRFIRFMVAQRNAVEARRRPRRTEAKSKHASSQGQGGAAVSGGSASSSSSASSGSSNTTSFAFLYVTPFDKVLRILDDLLQIPLVPLGLRDQLEKAVEIVASNQLASTAEESTENDQNKSRSEEAAHDMRPAGIRPADKPAGNTLQSGGWMLDSQHPRALPSFLDVTATRGGENFTKTFTSVVTSTDNKLGLTGASHSGFEFSGNNRGKGRRRRSYNSARRRAGFGADRTGTVSEAARLLLQLYSIAGVTASEETQLDQATRQIDDWNFDALHAADVCDAYLLPVVLTKCIAQYAVVKEYRLDFEKLYCFVSAVQASFPQDAVFHNAAHTADVLQAMHFFFSRGRLSNCLTDLDILLGFLAGLICHYQHPGVKNAFLVRSRHAWALRYNDVAVIQNHSVASACILMVKPETNFLGETLRPHWPGIRAWLASIILRQAPGTAAADVARLHAKTSTEFPSHLLEDRQLVLSTTLQAADVAFTYRPTPMYLRWKDKMMEEFYKQGEFEKELGLPLSPFCDRDSTMPGWKCQRAFFDVVVQPLIFGHVTLLMPRFKSLLLDEHFENNRKYVQQQITQIV
eukprot:GHVT01100807.1.p1 GENE.GHVT01100807.1~~GHVT01100807.1.p1  ORF type:complete len:1042 (-),score=104.53 GHVT01100807.1:715-3840(-)